MPFGKHKGRELSAIPVDYLEWLATLTDLRPPLKQSVTEELNRRHSRRQQRDPGRGHSNIPAELQPVCAEIVTRGYRALAQQAHPDHGGAHEAMLLVNRAIEYLRKIIK